ncbi:MAG: hypothetical protein AABW92_06105 [Nanoarchaeota archaeon]
MYIFEDPANAGLFAVPIIAAVIEPLVLLGTNDTNINIPILYTSFLAMYPTIVAGKYIGRSIGMLKDTLILH